MRKPIVASAVTGVVAALAVVPATVTATAKKSYTVRVTASGGKVTNGGTAQEDIKVTGAPFAGCTIDVSYSPPNVTQEWTCKGGTFQGRYAANVDGDTITGNAKLSHGTGKYKGISGTLKVSGSLSTGVVKLTGRARY